MVFFTSLSFIVLSYFCQINPIYFFTFPFYSTVDLSLLTLQLKDTSSYINLTNHNKASELIYLDLLKADLELPVLKSELLHQINDLNKYNRFTHITQYSILTSAVLVVNSAGLIILLSTLFYVLIILSLFTWLVLAIS